MIMGDHGRIGSHFRFLTRVGVFVVLPVLIGSQVRSSALNTIADLTQIPPPGRVPPRRAISPVVLTAVAVSTNQINLSWTNNSDKTVGLYVERSLSPKGPWKRVIDVPANATSCANAGLFAGTTYYYRVMANDSPHSNVASA